jgi:type I restriction enzyme S subunit
MNAQIFLENFWPIANAPSGVKRLREMILQLAVTGTLTEREQNDTQADVLFRRNQEHRDRLIEKKELQAQKPLPQIDDVSVPWIVPDTWKWCRLGQVTSYGSTDKAEYSDVNSETWVLELEDIEKETSRLLSKVRAKDRKFLSSKNQFVRGQVLYGKLRPYLDKVVIADEGGVCTTEIIPILPFEGILSEYLRWYLKCPFFKSYANNSTHGMNLPRLGTEPARLALFAFPPVEEQKRIVAKVDELMALCDKLEAQQQERERRFPVLSRACHARFVESPTLANLKAIFDEVESVSTEDLRKTILTLAVQGKLVSQDANDGTGEELLDRIKKVGKRKEYSSIRSSEAFFEAPKSWSWERLGNIAFSSDSGWSPRCDSGPRTENAWGVLKVSAVSWGKYLPQENKALPSNLEGRPDCEVMDGDFLLSRANTAELVARSVIVDKTPPRLMMSDKIVRFQIPEEIDKFFLNLVNLSEWARDYYARNASGTSSSMKNVSRQVMCELPVPIPPLAEQRRIVAKVDQLMALIDKLEEQQARKAKIAEAFAQAAVSAITGTEIKEPEKMKAPKTELVSRLQTRNTPNAADPAPLAKLLTDHNGELPAKALWQRSGLEIDAFYQQLRTEMANGWIIEPEKAVMKEIEAD